MGENMNANVVFRNEEAKQVLLDYNQFQTKILTSLRSGGKTYLVQDVDLLNRYFKRGRYFVYVRESQEEVDIALRSGFWDDHLISKPFYKDHEYRIFGNRIIIDDEVVGVAYALTTFCKLRGSQGGFGKVKESISKDRRKELEEQIEVVEKFAEDAPIDRMERIFFDEFEPLKPQMKSQARLEAFLHSADTFFRFRKNVETVMCGNLENCYSPFLDAFGFGDLKQLDIGIKKSYAAEPNAKGKREPLAVWCHLKPNEAWKEARNESYVGKIVRGKEIGHMFTTEGGYKGANFKKIEGKPKHRFILYNLTDGQEHLTVWGTREDVRYITARSDNITFPTYTFSLKLCGEGVRLLPDSYRRSILKIFESGKIEFDNARSFEIFLGMIPNKQNTK